MKYLKLTALIMLSLLLAVPSPAPAQDNPLAGYTVGVNVGYPAVAGKTYKDYGGTGPVVGIVGNTPYGFALGPFNIGVGFAIESALMKDNAQLGFLGTINTTIYTTPYGPLSYWGGVGYYNGLGLAGGLYYDYMIPNQPIVLKPYGRAIIQTKSQDEGGGMTGFALVGVMVTYDISTLFNK